MAAIGDADPHCWGCEPVRLGSGWGAGASITAILGNFGTLAAGAALLIIVRNMYERLKP